ncbi:MAG: hypothetical protein NT016_00055 [Candidatus Aenigmarchaeota archaeon]|nr:hypothetical protein [Candidatus Aenigmarchaeota archaeon]
MAGSLKKTYLSKLKSLEEYLNSKLPAWVPRDMENADMVVAALLTAASSTDAIITVLKNGTLIGVVESVAQNGDRSGSSLYMMESARVASYLISRVGFLPGVSLDQLIQASLFTITGYGLYKSSKTILDNKKIPHGYILARIPSYAILVAYAYFRAKCASSWL